MRCFLDILKMSYQDKTILKMSYAGYLICSFLFQAEANLRQLKQLK